MSSVYIVNTPLNLDLDQAHVETLRCKHPPYIPIRSVCPDHNIGNLYSLS